MPFSAQTFSIGQVLTAAQMNQVDTNIDEVRASHIGSAAPPALTAGVRWIDNGATPWVEQVYDGAAWIPTFDINATTNLATPRGVTGRQTTWVPAAAMWARTTSGASALTTEITSANYATQKGFTFAQSLQQFVQFDWFVPKGANVNSGVFMRFHWFANSTAGAVRWVAQNISWPNSGDLSAVFGSGQAVVQSYIAQLREHITGETAAIALTGGGARQRTKFQIYRDGLSALDVLTNSATLWGVELDYITSNPIDD